MLMRHGNAYKLKRRCKFVPVYLFCFPTNECSLEGTTTQLIKTIDCNFRNETMQTHPEMKKDVQRERERMEQDRASSLDQTLPSQQHYEQQQNQNHQDFHTATTSSDKGLDNNNTTTVIYNVKEITKEVIQQIKSDVTKLVKFLTPSPEVQQMLREQEKKMRLFYKQYIIPTIKEEVIPALQSLAVVVRDWGMTVVDMTRRYIQVTFMERKEQRHGSGDENGDDETPTNRNGEQSSISRR